MAHSNTLDEQTQTLQTGLRNLARQLVPTLLQALREASTDLAMANDRKLLFVVSEAVQTHRHAFEASFEQSVCPAPARESTEPRQAKASAFGELDLDALGLVDEAQADREIEVSRTVQLIELKAEWSWNEFQTFHASLQGDKTLRADTNPCAPRVFARALQTAADALGLPADPRALLLRVAARVLAQCLESFYTEHSQRLREHGVQPLALKAIPTPSARATPGSSANAGTGRPSVDVTQPGALEALLQQRPDLVDASHSPHVGARLLGQLVEQMAQDPQLPPAIQGLIAQLQSPIVGLAATDPQLLRSHRHPMWRLIDEMAHACAGDEHMPATSAGPGQDAALQAFVEFIAPRIAQLSQQDIGQLSTRCDELLAQIEQRKAVQHQALLRERHQALSSLDQVDQRETLKPLLRKQVSSQVAGQSMSDVVRLFLLDTWTEVMATAMARTAPTPQDTEQTQGLLSVVDDLLQSLNRPATSGEQEALRRLLPGLVNRLNQGMDLIQWPTSERQTLMNALLAVHSQHLRMPPRPSKPVSAQDSALAIVQSMRDEVIPENDGFSGATHTDVGDLPTIPMEYGADLSSATERHIEHGLEAGQAWTLALPCGQDVKLFVDGHWVRTRLLWVSANRQFLVFSARGTDRLHTLTQGALARLRREGLASEVQALSLMQRSVDSLLGDL